MFESICCVLVLLWSLVDLICVFDLCCCGVCWWLIVIHGIWVDVWLFDAMRGSCEVGITGDSGGRVKLIPNID